MPKVKYRTVKALPSRHIIVVTDVQEIVFGRMADCNISHGIAGLEDARVLLGCAAVSTGKVCELAVSGPETADVLSDTLPGIDLNGVRAVIDVTADAAAAWARHVNE